MSSFYSNRINCLIILLSSSRFSQTQRSPHVFYRHDLINQLQHNHALVTLVAENLATYMESMRLYARGMYCKLTGIMGNDSNVPPQLGAGSALITFEMTMDIFCVPFLAYDPLSLSS